MGLSGLLLGWTLVATDSRSILSLAATVGALGPVLIALALALGWAVLIPWGIASLGAAYAVALHGQNAIDGRAPLVGALLVLVAELSYWSLERRTAIGDEAGLHLRRGFTVLVTTLAAAAVSAVLLALTAVPLGGSVAWDALGMAAAAGAVATLAVLSRRWV